MTPVTLVVVPLGTGANVNVNAPYAPPLHTSFDTLPTIGDRIELEPGKLHIVRYRFWPVRAASTPTLYIEPLSL